ncbi:hypothetical protein JYU34_017595 [Plutella xylostella]|uniref:MADF domain-containing protein n=1 Tax=Plutella xylostella TaxID=51655 RepID=A0ABQ7Q1J3_PLUXY|nr:hypothetical protein JYU34_017595 [Plutella xylostella]
MLFTKAQTIRLIDAYHENEVLWNTKHPQYRSKNEREAAFQKIIEAVGIPDLTISGVAIKIQRIRSLYCAAVKKQVYYNVPPTMYWFKMADSFLRDVYNLYKMPQNMQDEIKNYQKNKIKCGNWKTTRVLPIILEYKKHPCLWNTLHPDYGKRDKYYEALLKIKKSLFICKTAGGPNISVLDIEKKIKYIRRVYSAERAKLLFENEKPCKYWYDMVDSFMQKFTDAYLLRNMKVEDLPKLNANRETKEWLLKRLQVPTTPKPIVTKTYTRSKKPIAGPSRPAPVQSCTTNEFKMYGQLLAEQLRTMPLSDALKLQEEMQALINKTRLSLNRPEEQPAPSTSDAFELQSVIKKERIKIEYEDNDFY